MRFTPMQAPCSLDICSYLHQQGIRCMQSRRSRAVFWMSVPVPLSIYSNISDHLVDKEKKYHLCLLMEHMDEHPCEIHFDACSLIFVYL